MRYFTEKNIFLFLVFLVLVLIIFKLVSFWSFPDTSWPIEKGDKVSLKAEKPFLEKFVANKDNLSRIDILFGNADIKPGGELQLKIADENCKNTIREKKLSVNELESDYTYSFKFKKIPDSKEQVYCLSLNFKPEPKAKSAKVFIHDNPSPQVLSLYNSDTEQDLPGQSLAMRPGYQGDNLLGDWNELNERISQYKPWFLKHSYLSFIAIAFILSSILVVIVLILL